jgi:hypothetical protein
MANIQDPREGLSPSPANILDMLTEDEDEDDDISFHAATESTDGTSITQEEEDSDVDFAGRTQTEL